MEIQNNLQTFIEKLFSEYTRDSYLDTRYSVQGLCTKYSLEELIAEQKKREKSKGIEDYEIIEFIKCVSDEELGLAIVIYNAERYRLYRSDHEYFELLEGKLKTEKPKKWCFAEGKQGRTDNKRDLQAFIEKLFSEYTRDSYLDTKYCIEWLCTGRTLEKLKAEQKKREEERNSGLRPTVMNYKIANLVKGVSDEELELATIIYNAERYRICRIERAECGELLWSQKTENERYDVVANGEEQMTEKQCAVKHALEMIIGCYSDRQYIGAKYMIRKLCTKYSLEELTGEQKKREEQKNSGVILPPLKNGKRDVLKTAEDEVLNLAVAIYNAPQFERRRNERCRTPKLAQ